MYFIEFFFLGVLLFILSGVFYFNDYFFSLTWDLGLMDDYLFCYDIYLDWYSVLFSGMIMIVGSIIMFYSYFYVDLYLVRFYYMMVFFLISMIFLVFGSSILSMLLGWDGLGVISFCLIWFYYGSFDSISNSLITMLYNRLGDSMILSGLSLYCLGYNIWGFGYFNLLDYSLYLICFGLVTKSAQFPFMSWLPKAMAAPTPVSSLVHSSTLVTSGLYILFRYSSVFGDYLMLLVYLGGFSMFVGGFGALIDFDIKKIIAYSTLSQIGLMVFSLGLGFSDFMFIHMLIHAIFKSMMFMCAGVIIHETGFQDIRYCSGVYIYMPYLVLVFVCSCYSLMGFPFFCGFYSKDLLVESVYLINFGFFYLFIYMFIVMLTVVYSSRLIYYLCFKNWGGVPICSLLDYKLLNSFFFMFWASLFSGGVFFAFFFDLITFSVLSVFVKLVIFFNLFLGFLVSYFYFGFNYFIKILYGYYLFRFFDCLYLYLKRVVFFCGGGLVYFDKFWLEYVFGWGLFSNLILVYDYIYVFFLNYLFYFLFVIILLLF